jgi:hypothetical protein
VLFPTVSEFPITAEEFTDRLVEVRSGYAEEVSDEAFEAVMAIFRNYGYFTRQSRIHTKDIVGLAELMKSILLRYHGIDHPMQEAIDTIIEITDMPELNSPVDDDPELLEEFSFEQE